MKTDVSKKMAKKSATKAAKVTAKKAAPRPSAATRGPKGQIWQWSAVDTAAAIRAGAVSAVEAVEAHL